MELDMSEFFAAHPNLPYANRDISKYAQQTNKSILLTQKQYIFMQ
jgi:hypothetical protein